MEGIYAYKNAADAMTYFAGTDYVFGSVYLWGHIVEHEHGYRAEFAYPKELFVSSAKDPTLIMGIEEGYGVTVKEDETLAAHAGKVIAANQQMAGMQQAQMNSMLGMAQISTSSSVGTLLGGALLGGVLGR